MLCSRTWTEKQKETSASSRYLVLIRQLTGHLVDVEPARFADMVQSFHGVFGYDVAAVSIGEEFPIADQFLDRSISAPNETHWIVLLP